MIKLRFLGKSPIFLYYDPDDDMEYIVLYIDFVNDEFSILPDRGTQRSIKGIENIYQKTKL